MCSGHDDLASTANEVTLLSLVHNPQKTATPSHDAIHPDSMPAVIPLGVGLRAFDSSFPRFHLTGSPWSTTWETTRAQDREASHER